jgi:hypothetical protein
VLLVERGDDTADLWPFYVGSGRGFFSLVFHFSPP